MKRLLTKCALLLALCAALALPALADSVTDTISVCIGYFGWTEDEYVEKAKFSWQELADWDGGDDLWVGAYQVEPMLALEDYTEWDTSGFDFESYVDESLFSTGNRFHLFFGQQSPEEAATSSAAKYVYKILVTFSGTPVLSSEEHNLDLIVGSDHALHVTADAEDDALTDYVQQNLQYVSSDPSVVSVDQYGRLHVNAEGDAVITASFG